jgi:hypothetical protein
MINFKRLELITHALKPALQTGKSFHTTFVYNKNKLICIAHNNYNKIHPYHKFGKYESTRADGDYKAGIHSECSAIIKMGLEDCSRLTFINIRISNEEKPAISKPCINCQRVLDQVGYKNIWYFDGKQYIKKQ